MHIGKIYLRLFVPFVIILVCALGGAWLVASHLFADTLEKRLQNQLDHTVELMASGTFPYTPSLLQRLARLVRSEIVLIDGNGQLSYSTFDTQPRDLESLLRKRSAELPEGHSRLVLEGRSYLAVLRRIDSQRDARFTHVAALAGLEDIQKTSRKAASLLGATAVGGLILLAWLGYRSNRKITRPISELARMSRQIADGSRNIRVTARGDDEIAELVAAFNDMANSLKDYEQEIERRSRLAALGEMTARIAHEIRNPLTAIKMQIELLEESVPQPMKPRLATLLNEARRLELMVQTTLQHGKTPELKPESTDIGALINEVVRLVRPQFEHQQLVIHTRFDESLPAIAIDRDMLNQVVLNLLLNAKEAMPTGGEIQLATGLSQDLQLARVVVDDSGPGIDEAVLPELFELGTSSKASGFGAGLHLCRELVELHRGHIAAEKSPLGGARFVIELPLTGEQA
jgi:signal transduction histidine kinase